MLQRMLDEYAIREVLNRYCRGIDRRQFDLVRSCYHPDASDDHGGFKGGVEAFIAMCTESLKRYERTMHFMGNQFVKLEEGADEGFVETYAVAYHMEAEGSPYPDLVMGVRYQDTVGRNGNDWIITARRAIPHWVRGPLPRPE